MRLFDAVIPRIARFTDAVVAATNAEAEQFQRLGCRRVEILPPGLHEREVIPETEAASFRQRFNVGNRPLVVTVVRRLERRKGMSFCLESLRALRRHLPDARLLIVGLEDLGALDVPDGVVLAGQLVDLDVVRAYRAADVVFVPSSYEAFSLIVTEAWQQARPVVVTDRVGLAESVREGGRVVPFGDPEAAANALRSFLTNPVFARDTGRHGREIVQARFSMPDILESVQLLYQELCDGKDTPSFNRGRMQIGQPRRASKGHVTT
jgi:glycosyltransferase involved in cell wall biosynthesis